MSFQRQIEKASRSPFHLWLLNLGLSRMIPFNAPHGLKVKALSPDGVEVFWPYKRKNLNHIKGLHACGMATLAEFTTGFSLLRKLDPSKYRLIMQKLQMDYHFQGKTHATAIFSVSDEWLNNQVLKPVGEKGAVIVDCTVEIKDTKGNLLSTGTISWQVKDWNKVKTKL